MKLNPILATDAYKLDHRRQYPEGTTRVYSNLTARGSRIPEIDHTVNFGLQYVLQSFLQEQFDEHFFDEAKDLVVREYQEFLNSILGPNSIGTQHIADLHDLGYLPLDIRSIPEGTKVPLRVPMMTIENTLPEFFWLTNYLETALSANMWLPITSATTAHRLRTMLDAAAAYSSSTPEAVDFQAHDFSMRGMQNVEASAISGAAHLLSFLGTDSIPAIDLIKHYYPAYYNASKERPPIGLSVAATEHSVMSAGGHLTETDTFSRLIDLYPSGIVSVVSDTWDLWNVLTEILPSLKSDIMARDGKLVVRPDSGDPELILCGDPSAKVDSPAHKGVVRLLWEHFGGTTNAQGFKELDSHIGTIYGDSITFDRAGAITSNLIGQGFASTNVVLGVGSFTYTYVTRDTFGMAMKATWAEVNGEGRNLFKDPITDDGLKKSATGRLAVWTDRGGKLQLREEATPGEEATSQLKQVFLDGELVNPVSFQQVRDRLKNS